MSYRRIFALALLALAAGCTSSDPKICTIQSGDLVVTEVFVNPDGDNIGKQWIELYNATSSEIDMSQMQVRYSKADGISNKKTHVMASARIQPGQYFVLGDVGPIARPAHIDYGYGNDLGTMLTTGGMLTLTKNDCRIEQATFPGFAGASAFLPGPQAPDAVANDTVDKWCKSQVVFANGFGTPQMANETCGGPDGGTAATTCKDNGRIRAIVPPLPGDLVINEIMANPALPMGVTSESKLEWFEVEVRAKGPVDLIGLRVGSSADLAKLKIPADLMAGDCWAAMSGDHALFVNNKDMTMNDGLPDTGLSFQATFSLANTGGAVSIGNAIMLLDTVTYPDQSKAPQGDGISYALDPDLPGQWCPGKQPYGPSMLNKGSPGARNPSCGIVPAGKCTDRSGDMGALRDMISPKLGDLMITEVMAKPSAGGNPAGEWFELKAINTVDLNGVQLGVDLGKLEAIVGGDCHQVAAGKSIVLAKMAGMNNGLPLLESWQTFKFGLTDAGGTLYLVAPAAGGGGMSILDQQAWKTKNAGDSYSRDANDKWCFITDPIYSYNGGMDRGTPGADNPVCP